MGAIFYVDSTRKGFDRETGDNAWENVTTFKTRKEAVDFCKRWYGADDKGRVCLIVEGEE